jgi:NADH-quinone oxidoreductase subunit N
VATKSVALFLALPPSLPPCFHFRRREPVLWVYAVDQYSQLFKVMIGFSLACCLIFGQNLKGIRSSRSAEYYMFLLLSVLGLMMLVSSVELIAIFVSLELSSFALYLLVPMRDDRTGIRVQMEAGMKYILFGVMATGFMLYGMSLSVRFDRNHLSQGYPGLSEQGQPVAAGSGGRCAHGLGWFFL